MKYLFLVACILIMVGSGVCEEEGQSIYSVPFKWTDDLGKPFSLSQLRGRPTVVSMLYTQCKNACPLTVNRLRLIEEKLGTVSSKVNFLLVTLDPGRDGVEELRRFKESHKIDRPNWHLLTGSESEVRKFSVLIGYSYQKDAATQEILHSNKLLVLTKDGVVSFTLEGLASDTLPLIKALESLNS